MEEVQNISEEHPLRTLWRWWLKSIAQEQEASRQQSRQERIEQGLDKEWYTVEEISKLEEVSKRSVYNWIDKGWLGASESVPNKKRIHKSDYAKFLARPARKNS